MNIKSQQKPIGIFGGTFDPIHLGHLHLAEQVLKKCDLDKIIFIPCYQSPLRKTPKAETTDRVAMLKLAIQNNKKFQIDTEEIFRLPPSYTLDTLKALHLKYKKQPLCLIMGFDAFLRFDEWHKWKEILDLAHLIITNRPRTPQLANKELIDLVRNHETHDLNNLRSAPSGFIYFIDINPLPVSATLIRTLVKENKSAEAFLPKAVWEYILKRDLYKNF